MLKNCQICGSVFCRPADISDRKWAYLKLCPRCEREKLKRIVLARVKVDDCGCWIWQLSLRNGYGQLRVHNKPVYVHRLSYELFVGPITPGLYVCHSCDIRSCCNPAHFFLGTCDDNLSDMRAKGRGVNPPRMYGEQHPNVTLSDSQVSEIRQLAIAGKKQRDIAAQFGCGQATVWRIIHKHVRCRDAEAL